MLQCPYSNYCSSLYRENKNSSYLRFFHASPNSPAVDIYLNNKLVVRRLPYKGFSTYLKTDPGRYNIKVFPANKRDYTVINTNITVPERVIMTNAIIGSLPNISLFPISEPVFPRTQSKVYIRFIHLSQNAPKVDVIVPGKGKIFSNVGFKEKTDYITLNAGNYIFDVNISGTDKRVLHVPNIKLFPNKIYTIYAVGLVGSSPPLQVVIPLDGNSYIEV